MAFIDDPFWHDVPMPSHRLEHPDLLADSPTLSRVLGPISDLRCEPFSAPGFSGARFERVSVTRPDGTTQSLVLKRARLEDDWTASRTADDFGRAAYLLDAAHLGAVWEIYACPYVAYAVADGEVGLLMDDLSPHLLPDVREPLTPEAEEALVGALADLHARFWNAPALDDPRLATASSLLAVVGPALAREDDLGAHPAPVLERAAQGWQAALRRHLPAPCVDRLLRDPDDVVRAWGPLPRTLVHGDAKVANFAPLPNGRVAAFDWGMVGAGPPALDLGWYLAVNATRIRGAKEDFVQRYRDRLEAALGFVIDERTWTRLVSAAIDTGATMLLWSKALALERGDAAARVEWDWWVDRLTRTASLRDG